MQAALMEYFLTASPAQALIAGIWQGLLLTGLAWAALKLAAKLNLSLRASTRFTLWLITFVLVALSPYITLQPQAAGLPLADHSLHVNVAWAFALEALWAIASLVSFGRLAVAGVHIGKLLRNATPVAFADLDAEIKTVVVRDGARPIEIRLSDALDAPSVAGFFRPVVLLPRALWGELEPGDLKQILLHEKAHLDRGDDWTNLLQKLFRALCPLNPALFWAERNLCLEREQACDEAVLDAAGNPRAYAICLTRLAENRLVKRAAALAPGMWKRHSELAGRVENILHRKAGQRPVFARAFVGVSLVASLLGAGLLARCPQLVTFRAGEVAAVASAPRIQPQAIFQQVGFHPAPAPRAVRHAVRKKQVAARVRIIALRSVDARVPITGTFTLVFFTGPSHSRWIIFQI